MALLFNPTLDDMISCVERELRFRRQVYPRRIAARKMTPEQSETEIATMEAVLDTLRAVQSGRRPA